MTALSKTLMGELTLLSVFVTLEPGEVVATVAAAGCLRGEFAAAF